jgi:dehydrogenase/reductase SDR family protein 7B
MEIFNDHVNVLLVCPGKIKTDISINAITGNGGKHNKMDQSQEQGLSAEVCADQVLKAINNNSTEIFIGGKELRAIWVKRFFPNLFTRLIRKQKPE